MAVLEIFNVEGKKISQDDFDDAIFSAPIRPYLHSEVVNWQRSCSRSGTQSALTKERFRVLLKSLLHKKVEVVLVKVR